MPVLVIITVVMRMVAVTFMVSMLVGVANALNVDMLKDVQLHIHKRDEKQPHHQGQNYFFVSGYKVSHIAGTPLTIRYYH